MPRHLSMDACEAASPWPAEARLDSSLSQETQSSSQLCVWCMFPLGHDQLESLTSLLESQSPEEIWFSEPSHPFHAYHPVSGTREGRPRHPFPPSVSSHPSPHAKPLQRFSSFQTQIPEQTHGGKQTRVVIRRWVGNTDSTSLGSINWNTCDVWMHSLTQQTGNKLSN